MSLLDPRLKQRLARVRMRVQRAEPFSGIGERRSKKHGSGMEFADHRPYQYGDDIRYLDSYAYSRLRQHHIKLFSIHQSLEIVLLVDASGSMAYGTPQKYRFAASLAAALSYIGLAGGDAVTVSVLASGRVDWFYRLTGVQRTRELFRWLESRRPDGTTDLVGAVRAAAERLPPTGVVVVLSDWLAGDNEAVVRLLEAAGQEVVGVQVLAPEELEPELLGAGAARLYDAETGAGPLEVSLDRVVFDRYRSELAELREGLARALTRRGGRYLAVRTDQRLSQVLLHDWRSSGFLW